MEKHELIQKVFEAANNRQLNILAKQAIDIINIGIIPDGGLIEIRYDKNAKGIYDAVTNEIVFVALKTSKLYNKDQIIMRKPITDEMKDACLIGYAVWESCIDKIEL